VAATGTALVQNGGLTVLPVTVKFERLDPIEGCKRTLSRETFGHGLRALAAVTLAATAIAPVVAACAVETIASATIEGAGASAWRAARHAAFCACGVGAAFAVAEYAFARVAWLRKLKMSFDERRREAKEQEGDPLERGRRRTLHRSLLRGAAAAVKNASFVIANPTHVAVALEYRPPRVSVPRIVVRAADEAAIRVRALAASYRIPVIENVALARTLYADCRVGQSIGVAHFVAVAEVVAALMRSKDLGA